MSAVITVFRSRLKNDDDQVYDKWSARMVELASGMPGFIAIKTFKADDGERVAIVEFESEETLSAWKKHPEHQQAQELGRQQFYAEFSLTTARVTNQIKFKSDKH